MTKREDILRAAEAAFEARGMHAVSIDEVIEAAKVSPRTLYKHFPSKTELAVAVLEVRHERFIGAMHAHMEAAREAPVLALFDGLEDWFARTGASGCLFLRALGEFEDAAVAREVARYKSDSRAFVAEAVRRQGAAPELADPLLTLIEGAVALTPSFGPQTAIAAARQGAETLLNAPMTTKVTP